MSNSYGHVPPPPSYPPPSPYGAPPPPRRPKPWLLIIIGVVLAALLVVGLAVGGVLLARNSDSSSPTEPITDLATQSATESATDPVTSPETSLPTPPSSDTARDALIGVWTGGYICAQGETRLRLTLAAGPGPADIEAVFAFGPTRDNPSVARGSFRMEGTFSDGLLDLHATTWIEQPDGYVTVDLRAPVAGAEPIGISGEILDAPGCTTFSVERQGP
jgi:hypothetical protein